MRTPQIIVAAADAPFVHFTLVDTVSCWPAVAGIRLENRYLTPPSHVNFAEPPVDPDVLVVPSHVHPDPAWNASELEKLASLTRLG